MDNKPTRVLIIEDDADEAGIIGSYLIDGADGAGTFALTKAPRISTACHLLAREDFDVILLDLVLPLSIGLDGFLKIRALKPQIPLIVLTGLQDEPLAIEALKLGSQDYLIKGSPDCCRLKRTIRYAIETKRLSNIIEGMLLADQTSVQVPNRAPAEENGQPRAGADSEQLKGLQAEIAQGLRALEVKNHFMSRISHELRNTLATMKTAAYCLRDGDSASLTPRQARMVDMISRNVDRQARIIDNLLDLAQFRSGKFNIRFRRTDMAEVVSEIVQEFWLLGAEQKLQVDIEPGLPLIKGDPDLIAQVLRNLIGNALGYAQRKVLIKASKAEPDGVAISVVDDGAGIAPERFAELFTEFVQLQKPANGNGHKGTGLGLTICKEIITGHNGKIWAENAPGQGARFNFLLPVNDTPEKAIATDGRVLTGSDSITND